MSGGEVGRSTCEAPSLQLMAVPDFPLSLLLLLICANLSSSMERECRKVGVAKAATFLQADRLLFSNLIYFGAGD
jgi:hypothetical protein